MKLKIISGSAKHVEDEYNKFVSTGDPLIKKTESSSQFHHWSDSEESGYETIHSVFIYYELPIRNPY